MALRNVSLKLFWNIKTFLTTTAFACLFQLPIIGPGEAGATAVFAPFVHLHVAMKRTGGKEASTAHGALVGFVRGVGFHVDL